MLDRRPSRRLIIIAILAIALVCCGCITAAFAASVTSPGGGAIVSGVQICAGAIVQPRTQVGIWWQAIFMSRLLPATVSPYAACTYTNWPDFWPPAGEIAFPP
jgi:hypothetical protein